MAASDMSEIRPKLWLAGREAAAELKHLSRRKVTHVLSVGSEFPEKLGVKSLEVEREVASRILEGRCSDGCRYLREGAKKSDPFVRLFVAVDDSSSADIAQYFDESRMFIKEGLSQGGILVHCWEGVSRSVAVVAAYLMQKEKLSVAATILSMKEKRPTINPSKFIDQLIAYEAKLGIAPASPRTAEAAGALKRKDRAVVNPQIFLDIACDGEPAGQVVVELFADVVPLTAENFRCLCTGERGKGITGKRLTYLGSTFHRIMPGIICGGDFSMANGTGGESIYGYSFDDENFEIKHNGPGVLSMANSGPNSNGSQFIICTQAMPQLDGKNVAFGKVISGYDEIVKEMQALGNEEGIPTKRIVIMDCGEVQQRGQKVKRLKKERAPMVQVLHILRKHTGCKKASSWREAKISCSQEDAVQHLADLGTQLVHLEAAEMRRRFQELAVLHSDCKSAKKGGELDPFERGMMPKAFEEASFGLQVGAMSEVVSDKHGEHLILRIL